MAIANIANGEAGSSVRTKLNSTIDEVSPIEAAAAGSVFQKGATVNEALSREDFGSQQEVFTKSLLIGANDCQNIKDYGVYGDVITESYKGTAYTTIGNFKTVPKLPTGNVSMKASMQLFPNGATKNQFALIQDANNYYTIDVYRTKVEFTEVLAGVSSVIKTQNNLMGGLFRANRITAELGIWQDTSNNQTNFYFSSPFIGIVVFTLSNPTLLAANLDKVGLSINQTANTVGSFINYAFI